MICLYKTKFDQIRGPLLQNAIYHRKIICNFHLIILEQVMYIISTYVDMCVFVTWTHTHINETHYKKFNGHANTPVLSVKLS